MTNELADLALTSGWSRTLRTQRQVFHAVILRDMQSRFFGTYAGILLVIAWPLTHIAMLLAINTVAGRATPYGDSTILWLCTGVVPYIAFSYSARFIMLGILWNKPLLTFPIVKITDLLLARAVLEVLNAVIVVMILMLLLTALGIDFTPFDIPQACYAFMASLYLGVGFGVLNGVFAGIFQPWVTGYAVFQLVIWAVSGVLFIPDSLPQIARTILSYNPLLDGVEWMRSAYYSGYHSSVLDKNYMLCCATAFLFLGLLFERLMRGRIMT